MKLKHIVIISIASLLLSIIAICISFFRCEPMTIDWMGVLVGILALLVTVLIGWQIFTLFNIKKTEDLVKRRHEDMYMKAEKSLAEAQMALWLYYSGQIDKEFFDKVTILCACIQSGIAAIFHFAACKEYRLCGECATRLTLLEDALFQAGIDERLLQSQIRVLLSVENGSEIQGYQELLGVLCRCLQQRG